MHQFLSRQLLQTYGKGKPRLTESRCSSQVMRFSRNRVHQSRGPDALPWKPLSSRSGAWCINSIDCWPNRLVPGAASEPPNLAQYSVIMYARCLSDDENPSRCSLVCSWVPPCRRLLCGRGAADVCSAPVRDRDSSSPPVGRRGMFCSHTHSAWRIKVLQMCFHYF